MRNLFTRFKKNDSGATAIEYALIAAIIAIGIILSLFSVRTQLIAALTAVATALASANSA
jgi:pilus assembly protein Flp/PilA